MKHSTLLEHAQSYLNTLCLDMPNRSVGRPANRKATYFFHQHVASFGFQTKCQSFDCIEWYPQAVTLTANSQSFIAHASPYSLGCHHAAELVVTRTLEELKQATLTNKILLICDKLAKEQLMPKNFVFYNPKEHQHIYKLLEQKSPAAIITATGKNPAVAGSMYPFPMIEDGDFDIPSVYMKDTAGEKLAAFAGQTVTLHFNSERILSTGCNVIARKGQDMQNRIVICAHIDAKENTPGALDNGSGIVVLMLLAELLEAYPGKRGIEIVALNGEDYYAASGQMKYLEINQPTMDHILLAINMDGAGYFKDQTAYSFYNVPDDIQKRCTQLFSQNPEFKSGDSWHQSDHMIFAMNQRPALAITSDYFMKNLSATITHTPKDKPDLVDCKKLIAIAQVIKKIIETI